MPFSLVRGGTKQLSVSGSNVNPAPAKIAVLGDPQFLARSNPSGYIAQSQWVLENAASLNIKAIAIMGDCVDTPFSGAAPQTDQWSACVAGMAPFKTASTPCNICQGNHDLGLQSGDFNRSAGPLYDTYLNQYFTGSEWPSLTFKDAGRVENNYYRTTVNGWPFLFLTIACYPTDADLTWAGSICDDFPNDTVVLITHALIDDTAAWLTSAVDVSIGYAWNPAANDGSAIWTKLLSVKSNIRLALCGHWAPDAYRVDRRNDGTQCTTIMTNFQREDNPGAGAPSGSPIYGWLALLTFNFTDWTITKSTINYITGETYPGSTTGYVGQYSTAGRQGWSLRSSFFPNGSAGRP